MRQSTAARSPQTPASQLSSLPPQKQSVGATARKWGLRVLAGFGILLAAPFVVAVAPGMLLAQPIIFPLARRAPRPVEPPSSTPDNGSAPAS